MAALTPSSWEHVTLELCAVLMDQGPCFVQRRGSGSVEKGRDLERGGEKMKS